MTTSAPHDPVIDPARLIEFTKFDLESPALRARLHELAATAATRFGLPIGLISLVLDSAQFFAGSHGLDGSWMQETEGTPVEWSFCATAVRTGLPYVVTDASVDPQTQQNPLVVEDGIRCYAGAPLITSTGQVLGTCCVVGYEPHDFSADEVGSLRALADEVMAVLGEFKCDRP